MIWYQSPSKNYQNSIKTMRGSIDVTSALEENAVIVFARIGCCISPVVGHLLRSVGAYPAVYEMENNDVDYIVRELKQADAGAGGSEGDLQFPTVFIGGRWFGGLDRIIAAHIAENLTPLLKQSGALWL